MTDILETRWTWTLATAAETLHVEPYILAAWLDRNRMRHDDALTNTDIDMINRFWHLED